MIREQIPDIWKTGSFLPSVVFGNCVLAVPGMSAWLPVMWLGNRHQVTVIVPRAEIDQNSPQLTLQAFSCRLQTLLVSVVSKQLHQTDFSSTIVVWVGGQIPGASYSTIFPESSWN